MDPLSKLPFECLQVIIGFFINDRDKNSLAALLRTNKCISSTTLALLYDEPYHYIRSLTLYSPLENDIRVGYKLTCLLLAQLPPDTLPPILHYAFPDIHAFQPIRSPLSSSSSSSPFLPINYLSYIHHFCVWSWSIDIPSFDLNAPHLAMAETMNQESVMRRLLMDCLLIGQDNSRNVGIVLRSRSRIFAFHEANWALANPIFEQLRSLSIPALDIIRYLKVLPRLSNLERVKIIMDDLLKISSGVRATTNILQPEINSRQEVIYDSIITFIEQHCKMFPGQLKTAEFPDGGFWVEASYSLLQGCPEHVRFKVYELLPPFQVTKVLTHFQLLQCLAHPFSDSLSHIKEIIQTNGPNRWLSHPEVSSEFILRCRSLETLYMQKVPEGIFKRAAEERRRMDSIGNTIPTATPTITTNNSLIAQDLLGKAQNSEENTYKLAPLTNVTLNDSSPTFVEDLRDLVVAFNRTLQKLVVQATVLDPSPDPMSSNCGHGWVDLPVLTHLDLDVGGRCLIIDEELLLHCRNLVLLKLVDKTIVYDSHKVTPCLPGNLPKLETLSLKGWSALTFDPSTLHSTTKLIDLSIKMQDGFDNIHYIPSLKELKNRPNVWTWDWYLPQLRHLKLSAEFAFQFQFKMLATCPALESLYLDSTTPDRRHPRYITHSDLFSTTTTDTVGVQRNQGNHSKPSAKKRIVAGKVKDLSMFGYCTIKSDVLTEFVRGMFPALEVLSISKWKGPNLEDYINMATGPGINSNDRETGDVYANKLTKLDLDLPRENMKYLRQLGLQKVEYLETSRPDNVIEVFVSEKDRTLYYVQK